jgi:hypothetical protein
VSSSFSDIVPDRLVPSHRLSSVHGRSVGNADFADESRLKTTFAIHGFLSAIIRVIGVSPRLFARGIGHSLRAIHVQFKPGTKLGPNLEKGRGTTPRPQSNPRIQVGECQEKRPKKIMSLLTWQSSRQDAKVQDSFMVRAAVLFSV